MSTWIMECPACERESEAEVDATSLYRTWQCPACEAENREERD